MENQSAEYKKACEVLGLKDKLEYYQNELTELQEAYKKYTNGTYKENFDGELGVLQIGNSVRTCEIKAKIELLSELLGIRIV